MRSDGRWGWLRSQGLGVLCGQATVLLLAVGSVVLVNTREGASAEVHLDDLTVFFARPAWTHAWLYALVGVLALYALNTALCTWDSVVAKLSHRVRDPAAWAPSLIHVSFLLALLSHLVGGFGSRDFEPLVIDAQWTDVGEGEAARVLELLVEPLPNGRPKAVHARLEWKERSGAVTVKTLGYNEPVTAGWGAELVLLEQASPPAQRAVQVRRRHAPGMPLALASAVVMALGLVLMGRRWSPRGTRSDE